MTSRTDRLYLNDPWLLSFDARVVAHASFDGRPSLVLDRTAFYPEAGGQMADHGVLGGLAVIDVQVDDAGVLHHVAEGTLPAVRAELRGEVDRARRREFMALHTAQHMLSRALLDECGAATVSSRLGEKSCTIDVDVERLDEGRVARAESLVNAVIDDDVRVRAFFPSAEELARLPLRREPKVDAEIRVIEIGDFDVTPCGGTHCTGTAQVGLVRVTGVERYKGKMRVSFSAGPRARGELFREQEVLRSLSSRFTCGPFDVAAAIDKLDRDLADARASLSKARGRLLEGMTAELLEEASSLGARPFVRVIEDGDAAALRTVAGRLTETGACVVLLAAPSAEGTQVLIARGPDSDFDCGAFLKRAAEASAGRGGGKKERAEGRLPPGVDWPALCARLLG